MDVLYFILCLFGGAFVVLIPWSGVVMAIIHGVPKTEREKAVATSKLTVEKGNKV